MQKKLENEIVHLIDLYESSTSFSTRNYYYNSIINLIDVYQDLTKKTIMFSPHFKDILYDSHLDKKINRTWINEVSSKNYRNMIDEICNNGIEIIDDNIKLEEQSFTDEISFKSACEIYIVFLKNMTKHYYHLLKIFWKTI